MAAPGANVSAIARQHEVAQSIIYRWCKDAAATEAKEAMPVFILEPAGYVLTPRV